MGIGRCEKENGGRESKGKAPLPHGHGAALATAGFVHPSESPHPHLPHGPQPHSPSIGMHAWGRGHCTHVVCMCNTIFVMVQWRSGQLELMKHSVLSFLACIHARLKGVSQYCITMPLCLMF